MVLAHAAETMSSHAPDHVYALLRFRDRVLRSAAARRLLSDWTACVEVRGPAGARAVCFRRGAIATPSERCETRPDLVVIGDSLVLTAVFEGYLTTRDAVVGGQLRVLGTRAHQDTLDALIAAIGRPAAEPADVVAIAS